MSRVRTPSIAPFLAIMTLWQAIILGIIQGITEFLPVSSSGHLALAQHLFELENLQNFILFNLVCHLGTLTAIFCFFYHSIKEALSFKSLRFWQIVIGTLPLVPLVFILKPIKSLFDQPQFLGPCFLATAFLLFASMYIMFPVKFSSKTKWQECLTIGMFQAAAILPGISRSGATISTAFILGWQKSEALQYSFLLAIPAIIGGAILESIKVFARAESIDVTIFVIGFITSFLFGFLSLWILIRWVVHDKWSYFAWYCLCIGLLSTLYFN